ncbi:lipoprotein-releasing ABC transporter permease subunit LolE [Candidatus Williamhamiltonella defendens]|uniref:lipoprotein-releasing ABC transporter permease subunit LolE n=1 Tax=Candidatus Williamhamiltonella defendens TaxID=138072 RepID=UPI00130E94D2|nr:lipoprotein-releasing ABC transporter permease subunit LolE [Candidatus Hamiltonella defensa]
MTLLFARAWLIAWRFNYDRRKGGMVSLLSLISIFSIALGVAVLIISLSTMNGFERELKNRVLAVVPHGQIHFLNLSVYDWPLILNRLEKIKGIISAAPYIDFTGLIENETKIRAVQINGVSLKREHSISILPDFILNDAWQKFKANQKQIILGQGLANILGVKVGSWLTILIPNINPQIRLLKPKRIHLQVIGVFQLSGQLDYNLAIIPLLDAQQYLEMGDKISGIKIKIKDIFNAEHITHKAAQSIKSAVNFSSWISTYGYMYHDIQMIRSIMYIAMVLVMSVASFNIVSTLIMVVKDKKNDIAILRTLGAQDKLIQTIFIFYGLWTGLIGSISGVFLGVLLSLKLTEIMHLLEKWMGYSFLSGDIYFINFFPVELHWFDVFYVFMTSLLLSLIASWYPARRANKLDPAKVLSGTN